MIIDENGCYPTMACMANIHNGRTAITCSSTKSKNEMVQRQKTTIGATTYIMGAILRKTFEVIEGPTTLYYLYGEVSKESNTFANIKRQGKSRRRKGGCNKMVTKKWTTSMTWHSKVTVTGWKEVILSSSEPQASDQKIKLVRNTSKLRKPADLDIG